MDGRFRTISHRPSTINQPSELDLLDDLAADAGYVVRGGVEVQGGGLAVLLVRVDLRLQLEPAVLELLQGGGLHVHRLAELPELAREPDPDLRIEAQVPAPDQRARERAARLRDQLL